MMQPTGTRGDLVPDSFAEDELLFRVSLRNCFSDLMWFSPYSELLYEPLVQLSWRDEQTDVFSFEIESNRILLVLLG